MSTRALSRSGSENRRISQYFIRDRCTLFEKLALPLQLHLAFFKQLSRLVQRALRSFYQRRGFPLSTLRPCFHTSAILFRGALALWMRVQRFAFTMKLAM